MAFDIGSVVARIDADVSGFKKGIAEAENTTQSFSKKLQGFGDSVTDWGKKISVVSAVVGGGLTIFLKQASEEANNFQKSMTTLDIISGRFGVSADDAKKAANQLGKELRIGVGPAAESIQNLLKSGLNLDQATELLKRFTNEAITGKSSSITLSEAVQNLSFAYATNNSALGNLSGISENFQNIIDKGREALVKEGASIKDVTDEQAKLRGMMDLTNLTMGSAERFQGTLIDKQAQLDQSLLELKISFGNLINPYLTQLVDWLRQAIEWLNGLNEEQKKWILIIGGIIAILGPLLVVLGVLISIIANVIAIVTAVGVAFVATIGIIALLVGAVVGLYIAWKTNFMGIQDQVRALWELVTMKFNEGVEFLKSIGGRIKDAIVRPFEEAFEKVKSVVNSIKEKLDFTKRNSPSVVDIVTKGVEKVNNALSGLEFGFNMTPEIASRAVTNNTTSPVVNQVRVDLAGAVIADEYSASAIGEILGDSIIKKLQLNVRF